jgi:endonuclease/exonuclease/phosphatase family metal-dependent hydrolase
MVTDSNKTNDSSKTIRALQFNVWLDATRVKGGLALTADKIVESEADIVSLCEVKNLLGDFLEKLKKELKARGVTYYGSFPGNPRKFGLDADTAIISKYPITEERIVYRRSENSIVRSVLEINGRSLAVYSVHLEYRAYTCYLPRGYNSNSESFPGWKMIRNQSSSWNTITAYFPGWITEMIRSGMPQPVTDVDVIRKDNIASTRPDAIARLIDDTHKLEKDDIPIIIMGDFNEPSSLDWTKDTADLADHNGLVYKWDSTELLKENGFVDSYRELYPNPVTHPGFTWPVAAKGMDEKSKNTGWIKMADERDRIDFIFYKGVRLEAQDAWLVGTPVSVVRDAFVDESPLSHDKWSQAAHSAWPSDHRAVLTVLKWSLNLVTDVR